MSDPFAPLLGELPGPDHDAEAAVRWRAANVLRPAGALARLDAIAVWLAGWQRTSRPRVAAPAVLIFGADHGVATEGVSAYPESVTEAMLRALQSGVATASVMAREVGAQLSVVDVGIGRPSANLLLEPALSADRFREVFEAGRSAVAGVKTDLLVLGEIGIGNTTAAAAVCATLYGGRVSEWTGRGTGVDDARLRRKQAVVEAARARIGMAVAPEEVLRQVGGAELVAMAGAVVEARLRSIPVVLDGFVVCAAVAPVAETVPGALDHCLAAHRSSEAAHGRLLDRLGKAPLLDLGLALGEGSGAVAAVPLIALAAASVTDVATFEEWGLGG